MWGRGRGSRYCPGCLADTGGRWQLRCRLTWSFAYTTHQRLLADTCPECDSVPGFRASESHLPPSSGYCEAPVPLPGESRRSGSRHRRCGAGLARTPTLQIPAGHPVLTAQQVLDQLIDGDTADFGLYAAAPQATITALADLRAIAGRVITHALHRDIPGDMAADHVTAELHQLARQQQASQHAAQHRVGAAPPMTAASALGLLCTVTQNEDDGDTQDEHGKPAHSGRVMAG